jgi:hypothetical protein
LQRLLRPLGVSSIEPPSGFGNRRIKTSKLRLSCLKNLCRGHIVRRLLQYLLRPCGSQTVVAVFQTSGSPVEKIFRLRFSDVYRLKWRR